VRLRKPICEEFRWVVDARVECVMVSGGSNSHYMLVRQQRGSCAGALSANYSARESLQQREGSGANEVGPHAQYPALFPQRGRHFLSCPQLPLSDSAHVPMPAKWQTSTDPGRVQYSAFAGSPRIGMKS